MTPQPSEQPRTAAAILIDALAEDERAWLLAEARELRPDDPGDTVPGRILERWETARSLTAAQRYLAPMTQPRTPTGRALVSMPLHTAGIGSDRDDDRLLAAILAIEAQATAPDPVATCSTCRHPYSEHTGRGLKNSRLVPEQARPGAACEHREDYHHTCPCAQYKPDPVASPLERVPFVRYQLTKGSTTLTFRVPPGTPMILEQSGWRITSEEGEGAVASPAPLDVERLARALLGHPWAGKDGHNCTGCPDGSPWRCDRPAHERPDR